MYVIAASAVNALFFFELVANLVVWDFKLIVNSKKVLLLEACLQVLSFITLYFLITGGVHATLEAKNLCSIIILTRFLRILHLLGEVRQFQTVLLTFYKFQRPFLTMMVSLYTVFFIFAEIGMLCFGGKIKTNSAQISEQSIPALYYLMNFNDFGSSMITLFHFMVVNNWMITCQMLMLVTGHTGPVVYFVLFWVFIVLIMMNIMVAFVLEIYDQVGSEVEHKFKRMKYIA